MKKFIPLLALLLVSCSPRIVRAQVPVTLGPVPQAQFVDQNGQPLSGGIFCSFSAGTNTPLATYTDSTGTVVNSNPIILSSSGRANIWFQASAYKLILAGGGTCASPVNLQWTVDGFSIGPFLAANNSWIGNNTFSGTTTFNGAVNINAGGAMNGTFTGNPTFSGNVSFTGTVTGVSINGPINTDTISGTLTNGGIFQFTTHAGAGSATGENLNIETGIGATGSGASGGYIRLAAGNGSSTGGTGGGITAIGGNAVSGTSNGGGISLTSGDGSGTGNGGVLNLLGGAGGATAGSVGGTINLQPGAKGAGGISGSILLSGSGRIANSVNVTSQRPTCSSTGIDAAGTCVVDNYSTDTSGRFVLTAGASAMDTGIITLTFNTTMGANGSVCLWNLGEGANAWDPLATIFVKAGGSATATATWYNNSNNLTDTDSYSVTYWCIGRH